jgi:Zn-dependent protease
MSTLQASRRFTSASTPRRRWPLGVRVELGFLMAAPLVGVRGGPSGMVRWGVVIFGSLLMHELVRSLVGVVRGHRATIVLTALGANTRFQPRLRPRSALGARLVGPALSAMMGLGFAYARNSGFSFDADWLRIASSFNLAWALINLLPIPSFDGGRALAIVLGKQGESAAMIVSVMTAEVATCVAIVALKSPELGALFLAAGVSSGWHWAQSHRRQLKARAESRLNAANVLLAGRNYPEAWDAAKDVATSACTSQLRNAALTTLAWVALGEQEPERAREILRHVLPAGAVDPYTLAAVESASGHSDRAIAAIDRARHTTPLGRDAVRLLVDLHASSGDYPQVAAIAHEFSRVLGLHDVRRVVRALEQAGKPELAASLTTASHSTR